MTDTNPPTEAELIAIDIERAQAARVNVTPEAWADRAWLSSVNDPATIADTPEAILRRLAFAAASSPLRDFDRRAALTLEEAAGSLGMPLEIFPIAWPAYFVRLAVRSRGTVADDGRFDLEPIDRYTPFLGEPLPAALLGFGPPYLAVMRDAEGGWHLCPYSPDIPGLPALLQRVGTAQDRLDTAADDWRTETLGDHESPCPPEALEAAERYLTARAELLVVLRAHLAPAPTVKRGRVGKRLAQPTWEEAREVVRGLTQPDEWAGVDGEPGSLRHTRDGARHELKLTSEPLAQVWDIVTAEQLQTVLEKLPFEAVLLFLVEVGLAARDGETTVSISELTRAIGVRTHTATDRAEWSRNVWRWTRMFTGLYIYGDRGPQKWRDPITRELLDTAIREPALTIVEERMPLGQLSLDPGTPPVEITWKGSRWLERNRHNRRLLTDFGDILRIASIPSGKVGGAWAQSIGLALQQKWREQADWLTQPAKAPRMNRFTRRMLLDTFPREPRYQALIALEQPNRIGDYWRKAIAALQEPAHRTIGKYEEPKKPRKGARVDWEAWLDQVVTIEPAPEDQRAATLIAEAGKVRRARQKRRPGRPKKVAETP